MNFTKALHGEIGEGITKRSVILLRVHIDHVRFNNWGKQSELMWHHLLFHPFQATEMHVLARVRGVYTSFPSIYQWRWQQQRDAIEGDR